MPADYAALLRQHAARWSVRFMALAGFWVVCVCVSLGQHTPVPVLAASALCAAAVLVCRIRYRQLRDAEDEQLISELRDILARGEQL